MERVDGLAKSFVRYKVCVLRLTKELTARLVIHTKHLGRRIYDVWLHDLQGEIDVWDQGIGVLTGELDASQVRTAKEQLLQLCALDAFRIIAERIVDIEVVVV